jgi:leucyl/phenylalanyl-tRNA--protein transferase
MQERGARLLDIQFVTPHLRRFGAVEIPRAAYLRRLRTALAIDAVLLP